MAVAVASGLIGNMSYDIVKKVFGKFVSYLKQSKKNCENETLVAFLESPEKIKKFSEYISAYYDEYEGADAKTKNAIMEKVFVDHVSHIIDGLLALEHGIRSIAFPSISTGVYSFPVELAAKIAVKTVSRYLQDNENSFDIVEWVLFDSATESVYEKEVDKLSS